jgi:hypothetical protein
MILAGLGALAMLRRSPRAFGLVVAFPLANFAFMVRQELFFARFAIPMLPFLAILAAYGLARVHGLLRPLPLRKGLALGLTVIALVQPAAYSIQSDLVDSRDDTRILADRWITANLSDQTLLLADTTSELRPWHLWPSRVGLPVRYFDQITDPAPLAAEPRRPLYVAITSFGYDGVRRGAGDTTVLPAEYSAYEQQGHLVATFTAGRSGTQVPYAQDDTYTPFWYLLERERPGPTVRIYRFD